MPSYSLQCFCFCQFSTKFNFYYKEFITLASLRLVSEAKNEKFEKSMKGGHFFLFKKIIPFIEFSKAYLERGSLKNTSDNNTKQKAQQMEA